MPDPLGKSDSRPPDLFDLLPPPTGMTTQQAGATAAAKSRSNRYRQILDLLIERGPLAGFELATAMSCQLHQISGRLTEMRDQQIIENSGERRRNPVTGAAGEVVRLKRGLANA